MRWVLFLISVIVTGLYGIVARGELSFGGEMVLPAIVFVLCFMVEVENDN